MDDPKIPLVNSEIIWCDFAEPERYITFGDELSLHVVEHRRDLNRIFGGLSLSEFKAKTIHCKTDIRHVKAMACNNNVQLNSSWDVLVALGYTNGKIALNSFDPNSQSHSLVGKEFTPKTNRTCNSLDFNQIDNHLLASGFERGRNDYSGLVWDLAHTGFSSNSKSHDQFSPSGNSTVATKHLYEFGYNEIVHSLKWFQSQSLIICGMNNKHIKLFDLRDLNKPKAVITKGVYGIALDNHNSGRFATFAENFVSTWDIRKFENPVITSTELNHVVKIEWCPTRSNILAVLLKDSSTIKLYDYKDIKNSMNEQEPQVFAREVSPYDRKHQQVISSFSWHNFTDSRMSIVSANGEVRDFKIIDRITLNWSPESEIIWTHGKKILQCVDSGDSFYENIDDIAVIMKDRAQDGYGLSKDQLWQMFPRQSSLHNLWKWAALRIKHDDETNNFFTQDNNERLLGIYSLLFNQNRLIHKSEYVSIARNLNFLSTRKRYTSVSRTKALQHCGWNANSELNSITFDDIMPCDFFIESNKRELNFSRSAAVLVFNGRISEAIDCLKDASNDSNFQQDGVSLSAIALALSAFLTSSSRLDNEQLWVEMCSGLKTKLLDPYLKAIFAFLSGTGSDNSYLDIINDSNLDIADRVAFACIYLPDESLEAFISDLKMSLFQKADLSAILLTGLGEEGLVLFSKYIEETSDVQTVSLLILWLLPNDVYNRDIARIWVQTYKNLLDRWRLWNIRCKFDIKWHSVVNDSERPKQKIVVASRLPHMSHVSGDSNYQQTCARCALCLTQLGTPAAAYKKTGQLFAKTENSCLSPFSSRWFTWCNSCRHIGHAHHMEDWFNENQAICPVAQCNCRCIFVDKC